MAAAPPATVIAASYVEDPSDVALREFVAKNGGKEAVLANEKLRAQLAPLLGVETAFLAEGIAALGRELKAVGTGVADANAKLDAQVSRCRKLKRCRLVRQAADGRMGYMCDRRLAHANAFDCLLRCPTVQAGGGRA